MQCRFLFSGKNKKHILNFSSAELAQRVVKIEENNLLPKRANAFLYQSSPDGKGDKYVHIRVFESISIHTSILLIFQATGRSLSRSEQLC